MTADLRHAIRDIALDLDAMARNAADWIATLLAAREGMLAVALSGGATPRPVYRLLAEDRRMPWPRVHWFWGDERFVPHDDPKSNFRMARETLLVHAPVPPENVHPVPTQGSAAAAAESYEAELRRFKASRGGKPLFDLNLLGIGANGHTASLFPGEPALDERARWVLAVCPPPGERISLTFPALGDSAVIAFLVSGAEKRKPLTEIMGGADLPAARVKTSGEMRVFLDRDAAP